MRRWKSLVLLLPLLTLGCGDQEIDIGAIIARQFPTIGRITFGPAIHESPIEFSFPTNAPENPDSNVFVSEVPFSYRSTTPPNQPFIQVGEITEGTIEGNVTTWTGTLPGLPLGIYELSVQPRIKYTPQSPDQPAVEDQPGLLMLQSQNFGVGSSEDCYGFGTDVEGWTVEGILEIEETEEDPDGVATTHPLPCDELIFLNSEALMRIGTSCLPNGEPASGNWAIDFVSPDLTNVDDWQGLVSLHFSIRADVGVKVQPILKALDPGGTTHTYAPVNAQEQRIFYDVGTGSRVISWAAPVPQNWTVTQFRVRVFVNPLVVFTDGVFARLGAACPID